MSDFQLVVPVMVHHQDKEPFASEISIEVNYDPVAENFNITATREFVQDIKDNFDNGYYTLDTTRTVTFVPKEEPKPKPKLVKPNLGGLEQYVGYQENIISDENKDDNAAFVFFLKVNNNDGQMSISIERDTIELKYNESEIQGKILESFEQFPGYEIPPFEGKEYQWEKYTKRIGFVSIPWYRKVNARERYYFYKEKQASAKIARQNRRGAGNTRFGDTLFYKGVNEFDCPIIVVKKGDLYGIFKHPDFDKYGFNLVRS